MDIDRISQMVCEPCKRTHSARFEHTQIEAKDEWLIDKFQERTMKAKESHVEKGSVATASPPTEVGSPVTFVNSPSLAFNTLHGMENESQKPEDSINIDQHDESISSVNLRASMDADQCHHVVDDAKDDSNQKNHRLSEYVDASDTSSLLSESNWPDIEDNLSELFGNDPHNYRLTPPASKAIMSKPGLKHPFNIMDHPATSSGKAESPSWPPKPKFDDRRAVITANVLWWDNLIGKGMVQEQKTHQVRTITWQDILPYYAGIDDSAMVQYQWSDYDRFEKFWVMHEGLAVL